jgi:hypothetical protein
MYLQRAAIYCLRLVQCVVQKWRKNPLECPTQAVEWCGHAAYAAHPLASVLWPPSATAADE